MALLMVWKTFLSIRPNSFAFLILGLSILSSMLIFKATLTSWGPLVLIMIFSSGMMTLFIYVTSLIPSEKKKSKRTGLGFLIAILSLSPMEYSLKKSKHSMKTFSQQSLLILMTVALILTMLAISLHSFNPQQAMSSTF